MYWIGALIVAEKKLSKKKHKKLSQLQLEAMGEYVRSELTRENEKIENKLKTIVERYSTHKIIQ